MGDEKEETVVESPKEETVVHDATSSGEPKKDEGTIPEKEHSGESDA
jgi:hypothetical protein